jgi:DNA-binding IclR family transcriptional regulator
MTSEVSPSDFVKSSARTLDILVTIARMPRGGTLTEVSRTLEIPPSSLHGLISTMVQKGFLARHSDSRRYRLGGKVAALVAAYHAQVDLPSLAASQLDQLAGRTGETTSLSVLQGNEIVFIDKRAGAGLVQVVNPVGTRLPAHATGSGKVMLAHLSQEELERLYPEEDLPVRTPATIRTRHRLFEALEEVRLQGYAFDESESDEGVWAVAACIRDSQGSPMGALSLVTPAFRVSDEHLNEWHVWVTEAALQISYALGYTAVTGEQEA